MRPRTTKHPPHSAARQAAACKQKGPPDSPQTAQADRRVRAHPLRENARAQGGRRRTEPQTDNTHKTQHNTNSAKAPRFVRVLSTAHAAVAGGSRNLPR